MFDRNRTKSYSTVIKEALKIGLALYLIGSFLLWSFDTQFFEAFLLRASFSALALLSVLTFINPKKTTEVISSLFLISVSLAALLIEFYIAKKFTFQASWLAGALMMMILCLGFLQKNKHIILYFALALSLFYTLLSFAPKTIAFSPVLIAVNITTILFIALISGVLRRKFLREQLGHQEALNTIFSNLDHGIIFHKSNGEIFFANTSAERILGLTYDQLIGKSSIDPIWKTYSPNGKLIPPEGLPSSIAQAKGEKVLNFKLKLHRIDNTWVDLSINAVPVIDPDTQNVMHTVVTIQDETEKLKVLNSVESLNRSLDMASRFASMGKIANHLAVEIRKPLFEIEETLQLLKNSHFNFSEPFVTDSSARHNLPTIKDLPEAIQKIDKSAKKIDHVVTSFVNLHNQSTEHQLRWIFLKDLLVDIKTLFQQKFSDAGIEFTFDAPSELTMYGNQTSIALALEDLIENSIEAISLLKEKWIHISVCQKDEKIIFKVIDSGHGIPESIQGKIFQPYFTTKRSDGHHFGMGLSIVQSIARAHSGSLRFDHSLPNTCAELTLQNQPIPT